MTPEQFVMWLHGYLEIENPEIIEVKQTQIIKDHLALMFKKETPDRTQKSPEILKRIDEVKQPSLMDIVEQMQKQPQITMSSICDGPLPCGRTHCVKCKNKMAIIC